MSEAIALAVPAVVDTWGADTDVSAIKSRRKLWIAGGLSASDEFQVYEANASGAATTVAEGKSNYAYLATVSGLSVAQTLLLPEDSCTHYRILRTKGTTAAVCSVSGDLASSVARITAPAQFIGAAGVDVARVYLWNNSTGLSVSLYVRLESSVNMPIDATNFVNVKVYRTIAGVVTLLATFTTSTTALGPDAPYVIPGGPWLVNSGEALSVAIDHVGGGTGMAYNLLVQPHE